MFHVVEVLKQFISLVSIYKAEDISNKIKMSNGINRKKDTT